MTSTAIPPATQFLQAERGLNARTIVVTVFVVVAHLALFATYVTRERSGVSGLRDAHAVAPSGPVEVVLLAAPSLAERPAPAGPLAPAPIHPSRSPAAHPLLRRKPAPTDIVAPAARASAPQNVATVPPASAAAGANGAGESAASAANAAKAPPVADAARFSARPQTKRADEVVCHIPAPAYPARARRLEEEGTASVRMTLDTSGRPTAVSLEQGTGFADLDSAALEAVRGAACEPYIDRGEAVPVSVVQAIDFKLARP